MKNIYLKRITTFCMALVAAWSLNAQTVVYSQDFEGTYPWGMTMVDNLGDGQVWQDNTVWTDGYDQNYTGGTGLCAMTNSDENSGVDWDTDMILPSIDLTTYTGASIQFKYNFQEFDGSQAWVDVSINGGSTWNNVWYRNGDDPVGGLGTPILTTANVNISAYAGYNVLIRFRYSDDFNWEWYWQVDDIVVSATASVSGNTIDFPTACGLGIAIPDDACPTITSATTTVSGLAPLTGSTTFLSAEMIVDHTFDGDLNVYLLSPAGTQVPLSLRRGGGGDDFGIVNGTCDQTTRFIMSAPTSVTVGTAPFLGDYLPEGDLNNFNNGQNPNGTWTLQICDDAGIDVGTIHYFNVTFNIPVVVPPTYCTPSSSNTCLDFWEYIDNFSLNTINNPSNCDGITYTDYTNLSTTLQVGVPSTATTSIGNYWSSDVTDIWIDLNVDGDFDDAGELVSTGNPQVGGISVASVLVPIGTPLGSTRLRVGLRDSQIDIADPCQTVAFGEFEDYTVDILAAPDCLPVTDLSASNISTTQAQLNWVTVPGALSYDVQYRAVGDPNWIFVGNFLDPTSSTIINGLLPQTQYEFQVMTRCSLTDSAAWSPSEIFSTSCFDCPLGAVTENEACGADANGGCNMVTPTYEPITAGVPVCGTGWADGTRDTDWYELVVSQTSTITVTLNADFPGAAGILDVSGGCGLLTLIDFQTTDINCSTTTATATVCPGTYIIFAAPSVFSGYPCGNGNNYNLVADVVPTGGGQVNEVACGAIEIPVGASCNPQTFDNLNTTFCPGGADPGCAFYQGQAVWFYLIVPPSGDVTIAGGAGSITDGGMAAYIGPDCNNLTQIACDDDSGPGFLPTIGLNGLTPGDTVWIQYWQYGGGAGTFDLCAFDCNFVPGPGTLELEACLGDDNGGCNAFPASYETLTCNETVIGTSYFDGNLRDTDWYTYTLTTTTSVSWTVEADFAPVAFILNDDCNNIQLLAQATGNPCDVVTCQAILGPGTYRFFVAPDFSTIFDCTAGDGDYRATINVSMPDPSIGAPGSACLSDLPITILAAAPGGTFSSNSAGIIDPLNGIFDPAAAGVGTWDIYYQIDANGCSVYDTISIVVGDIPSAATTPAGTTALCFNPADQTYTTGSIANADSYTWILTPTTAGTVTGTGTSVVVNFDDAFSGTASLVVAGVNECGTGAFSGSLDIVVTPLPGTAGTPAGPSSLCQDAPNTDYTTAGDPSSTSYAWSISPVNAGTISGTGSTGTVDWDPNFVGTATITVTGSNSCGTGTASASYSVTINSVSPATITPVAVFCISAQPTQLTATPAGGVWSGSPDVTPGGLFAPSAAGAYAITYTPSGGCSSPATILINVDDVPAAPQAPLGITSQCQDGPNTTVFVIPVQGATSYTWSFTPSGAGSYTDNGNSININWNANFFGQAEVIVAATNGCGTGLFSPMYLIDINPTPEPIITQVGPFCQTDQDFPLTADIAGGFWGGSGVNGANFNPSNGTIGSNSVIYTVAVNGCIGDDTIQVQVQPAPVVTITTPSTICSNDGPVTLNGSPNGGTWSGTDISGGGTFANTSGPGTYTATYTINDNQNGCSGEATIDFDVTGFPVAQFSYSAQCQALTFYNESQNDDNASYGWQFGDVNNSTSTAENTSFIYDEDGTIQVTFTVTNACGTSDTTMQVVVIKCLGVEENGVVDGLSLYPNPTSGLLNVFFTSNTAQNYHINVLDITGKVLYNEMLNNFAGQYNNPLDMTTYASGMYIFRIVGEDGRAANIKIVRD